MTRYLITGVAGFIGSSLARSALQYGEVRGIDNFSTGHKANIAEVLNKIDFREADLLDEDALRDACAGVDYVLHQAAIPSVPKSIADPWNSNRANIDGTLNLLLAARDAKVKRVVYAASSSAYGNQPTLPKHESMAPNPISPYAVAKLAGEMYMKSFFQCYGLETVCLRYFNVFGPRQDPASPYSAVLAKFISSMLRDLPITIYGDGEQSRDFTYIDNVVEANFKACGAPAEKAAGRVFNIACGQRITLNQAYDILRNLTGYARPPERTSERPGDVKHSLADIGAAREVLGYEPGVDFATGLERTVSYYRNCA